MLKLFLLGRSYVELDGKEVYLSRRKNLALLAYLALTDERHSREEIATLLWPELDSLHSLTALRRDLHVLRKSLGDFGLVASRQVIGLHQNGAIWCDALTFQQRLSAHRTWLAAGSPNGTGQAAENIERLTTAVELYRDDFMRGFTLRDSEPFDEWQTAQTERLRHDLMVALKYLVDVYESRHNFDLAILYTQRLLEADPLNESVHRKLMTFYGQTGQHTAALQQFQRYTDLWADNLGVPPSDEMIQFREHLWAASQSSVDPALAEIDGQIDPLQDRSLAVQPSALPKFHSSFVGRIEELDQITQLLATPACRLLTVVGPGGIGKTRLAVEVAAQQATNYPDGVYFIDLVALRQVDRLPLTILETLGLAQLPAQSPEETLLGALRNRHLLLILDNFEQLRAGTPLLQKILAGAEAVQLLVTSRERLNLHAEWRFPLSEMPYPSPSEQRPTVAASETVDDVSQFEAVQLFMACVQRILPSTSLPPAEQWAVAEICRLVEGIPLAIELAAGWIALMSCVEIVCELRQGLHLLTTSLEDVPERHRSMRSVLEQSWQRLSPRAQNVLCRLAVFQGGFQPAAAQAVAEADLALLLDLAEKSWLHRTGQGRLTMHALIHQFCTEKLTHSTLDQPSLFFRHAQYYADFLAQCQAELGDKRQVTAVRKIVAEVDNIRAFWAWATAAADLQLLNMALAVGAYRPLSFRFGGICFGSSRL